PVDMPIHTTSEPGAVDDVVDDVWLPFAKGEGRALEQVMAVFDEPIVVESFLEYRSPVEHGPTRRSPFGPSRDRRRSARPAAASSFQDRTGTAGDWHAAAGPAPATIRFASSVS